MSRVVKSIVVMVVASLSLPAWAGGFPTQPGALGAFLYDWDIVNLRASTNNTYWNPGAGSFGMMWDGPTTVYSMSITQLNAYGCQLPKTLRVYTSPTDYTVHELAYRPSEQTITFTPPLNAVNSYLMVAVIDMWPNTNSSYGAQNHPGFSLDSLSFNTVSAGSADVNYNCLPGVTITSSRPESSTNGPLSLIHDGVIASNANTDAPFWKLDDGAFSIKAEYDGNGREIGSIGLGFSGNFTNYMCPATVLVTAVGIDESVMQDTISISQYTSQYGRYVLDPEIFKGNLASLTVTFSPVSGRTTAALCPTGSRLTPAQTTASRW